MDLDALLLQSFETTVKAAHPDQCLKDIILPRPKGKLIVIGAGKASAAMAAAFEKNYDGPMQGLVVTRYGHSAPTKHISIVEAAHPVPDKAGQDAVIEMLDILTSAQEEDLILCLISGGGSSLLSAPIDGLSFEDIRDINAALLKSGADITEMNIVRKHLNRALGGGLAVAAPRTKMITLAISDVTGDDPATIASGATIADPTTLKEAREVLKKYSIDVPAPVAKALNDSKNETPKPDNPAFDNNEYHLIATPQIALDAAAALWKERGFTPYILDAEMEGDTNECAKAHATFIQRVLNGQEDIPLPCAILSGGETTVKVTGSGQGGPNTQCMLQAAILLKAHPQIYAMACDTDGIDGSADNAGALITPQTLSHAQAKGLDPQAYLDDNNSYDFFKALDQLVITGPTHTNVNDYRVFLIFPPSP